MPDVLVFGATGYTGRLTAHALARRGADFVVAGRNPEKLETLASETGACAVRVVEAGDADALTNALRDTRVLLTCVGPFVELGRTAVTAALRARTHYIDSTGEGPFIGELIDRFDPEARAAGVAMVPAMGFDEVPADVAASLATEGMRAAELNLTYAVPTQPSAGTLRSMIGIITSPGPWLEDGRRTEQRAGARRRWAPMPPPLGPKATVSFPLAEAHLAPLHLDLRSLGTYVTVGGPQRLALTAGLPALTAALRLPGIKAALNAAIGLAPEGPGQKTRSKGRWTILAEARADGAWRNVVVQGSDVYGLTAETLAAGALRLAAPDYEGAGVMAPVQAVGQEVLQKTLIDHGVSFETYEEV